VRAPISEGALAARHRQYNAQMGAAGWRIVFLASLGGALEFYE
jgi:hypothetical protein